MKPIIDKQLVEQHFSRNAVQYDDVAPVQRAMGDVLLNHMRKKCLGFVPKRILELGCGTGNLTVNLASTYENAEIMAIDISPAMVKTAKARIGANENIKFMVADAEDVVEKVLPPSKFDLIISNATIQWFNQPELSMRKYISLLTEGGVLCFSTFGPQTFMELRFALEATENALNREHTPHILHFPSVKDWTASMPTDPVYDLTVIEKTDAFIYSTVTQFLFSIKMAGATTPYRRKAFTMGKRFYQKLKEEYDRRWRLQGDDGVTATYHMIYLILEHHPPLDFRMDD